MAFEPAQINTTAPPELPPLAGFRYPHLNQLWAQLSAEPELPQLDRWLRQTMRQQTKLGRQDRLLYADVLFTLMRYLLPVVRLELAWQQLPEQGAETASLWQSARQLSAAPLWGWLIILTQSTQASWPQELADEMAARQAFAQQQLSQWAALPEQQAVRWGWAPEWLAQVTVRGQMAQWPAEMQQQFILGPLRRPPLWLRLQHPERQQHVVTELTDAGFTLAWQEDAICATGTRSLEQTTAYQQGWIEIQDWSSQQISRAVAAQPGDLVWDACAGAGGKTLAIASQLQNRGAVIATDTRAHALEALRARAKRAGWFNVRRFTWDATTPLRWPKEAAQRGGFDCVLIDAPCSASGTWRRNPDARWRLQPSTLAVLTTLQQQLLAQCARAVKPGGALVYATCSWLAAENEVQVAQFLTQHPEFSLQYQQLVGFPEVDADTMFVARLQRQPVSAYQPASE